MRRENGTRSRARVGVFDDVIEAIAAQDVHVIARAMDAVGQRARYHSPDQPHAVVLQHLLERIDECAVLGATSDAALWARLRHSR